MEKVQILILAAGKGKRMNSDLPKALLPLRGRPMVSYLLDSVNKARTSRAFFIPKVAIVVGYKAHLVKKELGDEYLYIYQRKQLGTGHAVWCAKKKLLGRSKHVLVLYADQPFIRPRTIHTMIQTHEQNGKAMTLATVRVKDFDSWRQSLYQFGRIIRDNTGKIQRIVDIQDADLEQKQIQEVSPTYFCFKENWLWRNIEKIKNKNAQAEYYLTDLVPMALKQEGDIPSIQVDAKEALGVNTIAQLKVLERMIDKFA